MTGQPTLEGVALYDLKQIEDERGAVLHMMRSDAPEFTKFGECYFSEIVPGAIKAWKRHRVQTQVFAVPVGRIRIVIYDDREGSTTQGQTMEVELGRPDAYKRLHISPGLWYGFTCVGDSPALITNCADHPHDPSEGDNLPHDDRAIPYQWPAQNS